MKRTIRIYAHDLFNVKLKLEIQRTNVSRYDFITFVESLDDEAHDLLRRHFHPRNIKVRQ